MKTLITGGSGLLGQYLNIEFSKVHEILTLYNQTIGNASNFRSIQVDITDFEKLENILNDFNPDVIIHTAAISRPESAEELPLKFVEDVNVNSTKLLAEFCKSENKKIIYTSTDLVYDGDQGEFIPESGKVNPISVYAKTKLRGEEVIKNATTNYIILRTSLLYGLGIEHSKNNFHLMIKKLQKGESVNLFFDQFRTPLELNDAARLIREIAESEIKTQLFNFGGKERVSRLQLGEIYCDMAGINKKLINPISLESVPSLKKVRDASLNTNKLNSFGFYQLGISESVQRILSQ